MSAEEQPRGPLTMMSGADMSPWFSTAEAAIYCGTTPRALLSHISRGKLKPDAWGSRGRFKSHRFSKETLDAFVLGTNSTK